MLACCQNLCFLVKPVGLVNHVVAELRDMSVGKKKIDAVNNDADLIKASNEFVGRGFYVARWPEGLSVVLGAMFIRRNIPTSTAW